MGILGKEEHRGYEHGLELYGLGSDWDNVWYIKCFLKLFCCCYFCFFFFLPVSEALWQRRLSSEFQGV